MDGSGDEALRARVEELEGRVAQLTGLVGTLADERERLNQLVARAEDALRGQVAPGVTASSVTAPGIAAPRFRAAMDTVYQATSLGYVAAYFVSGRTARVRLLIGYENPPTNEVGSANASAELNEYIGGVVRPGEYWVAATHRPGKKCGFECVFTPF
ncbi:hypothetical protein F0L68_02130 [Solihabitans fulvus]|uniref:Uncharacterized protein n=1 Tax=Solihabitans fulvus TaxID=1892852 RepID=A0A5B2XS84_9PSEU|nr:bZIP transcription factor [Solihabitans fulvus]KAA2266557.1 hypothetical protein F0L68_02130 [Solihabitans fulvus]